MFLMAETAVSRREGAPLRTLEQGSPPEALSWLCSSLPQA